MRKAEDMIVKASGKIPEFVRDAIASFALMLLVFLSPCAVHALEPIGRWKNYWWIGMVLIGIVVFVLMGYAGDDSEPKRRRLRIPLCIVTAAFVGWMMISELAVPKERPVYQGTAWLFAFYILMGLILGRSGKVRAKFVENFMRGVSLSFFPSVVFSFCFRPLIEGGGYMGIYANANSLGIYLVLVLGTAIWGLDSLVFGRQKRPELVAYYMIEIVVSAFFMIKSGSRASTINMIGLFLLWGLMALLEREHRRKIWKLIVLYGTLLAFTVVSYPMLNKALNVIPERVGHPIESPKDSFKRSETTYREAENEDVFLTEADAEHYINVAMDAGGEDSLIDDLMGNNSSVYRILKTLKSKSWTEFLGARSWIYDYAIHHQNLLGHENGQFTDEEGRSQYHMHDNALQYGYVYGYPAMILYIILVVLLLVYLFARKDIFTPVHFGCALIALIFVVSFIFESGVTVVRDLMNIPYLMVLGMSLWKENKENKQKLENKETC